MTTIGRLLTRLHQDAWDAAGDHPSPSRRRCGVGRVAAAASRCLKLLDERADLWGHLDLLESLVDHTHPSAPGLARIATSLGAIADVLGSSQDEVRLSAAVERSRLSTHVQAALHAVVRAPIPGVSPPHRASLSAVAAATETSALVPPNALTTTLSHLSAGGDAITHWGRIATQSLSQPASVTGYALQRTAVDIARVCHTASRTATDPGVRSALADVSAAWRAAAAWPVHLRLGGRTPDLTPASVNLAHELGADALPWVTVLHALRAAADVAAAHSRCLGVLAQTHQLWVAASTLAATGQHGATAWVREPADRSDSRDLANRSAAATAALAQMLNEMGKPPVVRWETVTPPRPRREMAPRMVQPALPGVTW